MTLLPKPLTVETDREETEASTRIWIFILFLPTASTSLCQNLYQETEEYRSREVVAIANNEWMNDAKESNVKMMNQLIKITTGNGKSSQSNLATKRDITKMKMNMCDGEGENVDSDANLDKFDATNYMKELTPSQDQDCQTRAKVIIGENNRLEESALRMSIIGENNRSEKSALRMYTKNLLKIEVPEDQESAHEVWKQKRFGCQKGSPFRRRRKQSIHQQAIQRGEC